VLHETRHSAGSNAWLFFWMAAATLLTTSFAHKYANQAALMAANASSSRANVVYIQHSAAIGM